MCNIENDISYSAENVYKHFPSVSPKRYIHMQASMIACSKDYCLTATTYKLPRVKSDEAMMKAMQQCIKVNLPTHIYYRARQNKRMYGRRKQHRRRHSATTSQEVMAMRTLRPKTRKKSEEKSKNCVKTGLPIYRIYSYFPFSFKEEFRLARIQIIQNRIVEQTRNIVPSVAFLTCTISVWHALLTISSHLFIFNHLIVTLYRVTIEQYHITPFIKDFFCTLKRATLHVMSFFEENGMEWGRKQATGTIPGK